MAHLKILMYTFEPVRGQLGKHSDKPSSLLLYLLQRRDLIIDRKLFLRQEDFLNTNTCLICVRIWPHRNGILSQDQRRINLGHFSRIYHPFYHWTLIAHKVDCTQEHH